MSLLRPILQIIIGWLAYAAIFTLAAALFNYAMAVYQGTFSESATSLFIALGLFYLEALVLSGTGFIVYGFLKHGLGVIPWMNRSHNGRIVRVGLLFLLCTFSMIITYAIAARSLPLEVMIDFPILNTVTILIFAVIPYFRDGLLGEQD